MRTGIVSILFHSLPVIYSRSGARERERDKASSISQAAERYRCYAERARQNARESCERFERGKSQLQLTEIKQPSEPSINMSTASSAGRLNSVNS